MRSQHLQSINSTIFCDKKLVAINHLYNDDASEAILSVRGTVRGIKNRVRAGIQAFAQDKVKLHFRNCHLSHRLHVFNCQQITGSEYGQCVMYMTTLGIVRSTKARCSNVRKILRNLSVR